MQIKLLMRWDILPETESEYFEFLVHEFIPSLNKLGATDIQVWYTAFGDCEQKQAEGIMESSQKMKKVLSSEQWLSLLETLQGYVDNFTLKVIPATRGFQI